MSDNKNPQAALNLINIESLINSHDSRLAILDKELKVQRDMIKGLLENDDEFQKLDEDCKKIGKARTLAKSKVMAKPEAKTTLEKLKDAQSQVKELKVALSDYLSQYVTISGSNQIEGPDGVLRKIIYTAKLVKKLE
jgi:hypothetical protein